MNRRRQPPNHNRWVNNTEFDQIRSSSHRAMHPLQGHSRLPTTLDLSRRLTPNEVLRLQRTHGNHFTTNLLRDCRLTRPNLAPPIQRYQVINVPHLGQGKITQNGSYILLNSDENTLYVRTGATLPIICQAVTAPTFQFNGQTYFPHRPMSLFFPDCLKTAEEIMHRQLDLDTKTAKSVAKGTSTTTGEPRKFGFSDPSNIAAAKQYQTLAATSTNGVNDGANPSVGEAFAIVETQLSQDSTPYHAAAVVAIDGVDRITVEQTAPVGDEEKPDRRVYNGIFDMYFSGDTFHSRYSGGYASPITIVIQPR